MAQRSELSSEIARVEIGLNGREVCEFEQVPEAQEDRDEKIKFGEL
jgi:hypothetical protein